MPEGLSTGRLPGVTSVAAEADRLLSAFGEKGASVLPRKAFEVRQSLATRVTPNAVEDLLFGQEELVAQLAKVQKDLFFVEFVEEFAVVGVGEFEASHVEGHLGGSGLGEGGVGGVLGEGVVGGHGVFNCEGVEGSTAFFGVGGEMGMRRVYSARPGYRLVDEVGVGFGGGEEDAGVHL